MVCQGFAKSNIDGNPLPKVFRFGEKTIRGAVGVQTSCGILGTFVTFFLFTFWGEKIGQRFRVLSTIHALSSA